MEQRTCAIQCSRSYGRANCAGASARDSADTAGTGSVPMLVIVARNRFANFDIIPLN